MKVRWYFIMGILSITLGACAKTDKSEIEEVKETEASSVLVSQEIVKRSDIINNVLIGNTKMSFNNTTFNQMVDGNFTQNVLWGSFQEEGNDSTYLQIDASDNTQAIYGELSGYKLEDIEWAEAETVQYLGVMEEAIQHSKDQKVFMYKARTGDVIFSVALIGKEELSEEQILSLKGQAKEIKIEYVDGQVVSDE